MSTAGTPPRANRVTPFGVREAVRARGLFMGNRGILAGPGGRPRPFGTRTWVCCRLAFRGRRVPLDDPHRYTPLFFHDEAVALAAGHRPCGECRNGDHRAFKAAFARAHGLAQGRLSAVEMDRMLHPARILKGAKVTYRAPLAALPDGTFVTRDAAPAEACLVAGGKLHPWSHAGYAAPIAMADEAVSVLTPAPIVAALAAGYVPVCAGLREAEG